MKQGNYRLWINFFIKQSKTYKYSFDITKHRGSSHNLSCLTSKFFCQKHIFRFVSNKITSLKIIQYYSVKISRKTHERMATEIYLNFLTIKCFTIDFECQLYIFTFVLEYHKVILISEFSFEILMILKNVKVNFCSSSLKKDKNFFQQKG